jgi:hypothetical protein
MGSIRDARQAGPRPAASATIASAAAEAMSTSGVRFQLEEQRAREPSGRVPVVGIQYVRDRIASTAV